MLVKTRRPQTSKYDEEESEYDFTPVAGAPKSEQPLYYSQRCGHQLFPSHAVPDGGDPACFSWLFARIDSFSWILRRGGYLVASAGVLLQLAASAAAFKGDETLLWRYEIIEGSDVDSDAEYEPERPRDAQGGRPSQSEAVAAVLELIDRHIPHLFEAGEAPSVGEYRLRCKCPGEETAYGRQHNRCRCRWVLDYSADPRALSCKQRRWLAVLHDAIVMAARAVDFLESARAAAGDHLSVLWLSLARLPLDAFHRDGINVYISQTVTTVKEVDAFQTAVRSGLALRVDSAAPSPAPSPERESEEALRVARLPLAEAFAACAQRPDIALEAALIRRARTGFLPREEESPATSDPPPADVCKAPSSGHEDAQNKKPRERAWFASLHEAGLGAFAARYYLHNTDLDHACLMYDFFNDLEPNLHCKYVSRIRDAIFGPVSGDCTSEASAAHALSVAKSLLAARQGAGLSVLGESEPASPQQYETLLAACLLRLLNLRQYLEALRLFDLVGVEELCRFFTAEAAAGGRALRSLDSSVSARIADFLLRTHLSENGGSLFCVDGLQIRNGGGSDERIAAAAQTLVAASRQDDGSSTAILARVSLQLLAQVGRSINHPCGEADECDWLLRCAVLLDASEDVESAAPMVFSAILGAGNRPHFEFAVRFIDSVAPRLAERCGVPTGDVGPAVLRRRLFAHFLGRFGDREPIEVLERRLFLCNAEVEKVHKSLWGLYKPLAEKAIGWGVEEPELVDYFLAAKIGIAALSSPRSISHLSSIYVPSATLLWRRILGEIHVLLRAAAGTSGPGAEEERADALRLAELVWGVCPCVQAVWVIRDALSASAPAAAARAAPGEAAGADHDRGARFGEWLKVRLDELRENAPLIFAGELELPRHDQENISGESEDTARLVLAAGALLLACDRDRENVLSERSTPMQKKVEAALWLDTTRRPEGCLLVVMLLARWCEVADLAMMPFDTDCTVAENVDWQSSADMSAASHCLMHYAFKTPVSSSPGLNEDPEASPISGLYHGAEDALSIEQLEALSAQILEHQRMRKSSQAAAAAGNAAAGEECGLQDCRLCQNAWHSRGRSVYSLGILGDPTTRLLVETALWFPWEESNCGTMAYALSTKYVAEKAAGIAIWSAEVREGELSESQRASFVQSAHKVCTFSALSRLASTRFQY
eukprot:tig00021246_g19602.t1